MMMMISIQPCPTIDDSMNQEMIFFCIGSRRKKIEKNAKVLLLSGRKKRCVSTVVNGDQ